MSVIKTAGACDGGIKLIFPCSGAADVGEISDKAARGLTAQGHGKMFCLAGIGGNINGIIRIEKSKSPATQYRISKVIDHAKKILVLST